MADVRIRLEPPVGFILRQAGAFRSDLENLQPLWDRFKPIMTEIEEEQFATHGHGAWPPWSPNTRVHGSDLLVLTGALKGSLVDAGAAVKSEGPTEMVWGTDVFYAGFHQSGTEKMPQRMVIDVQDTTKFQMETVAWVNEVAARTWGAI